MSPDLNIENDAELLALLSNANKQAFDKLYNKYWKQVYNAAYKRLNDADKAQDVAQDVFVQLWTRGTKAPIENLSAYLYTAARNGVFKQLEKDVKYMSLADTAENLESTFGGADAHVLHEEFLKTFKALVDTLPPQQKIIFNLRFNEGLSSQEIASQLEISPKTVRNQMGRALATLRRSIFLIQIAVLFANR